MNPTPATQVVDGLPRILLAEDDAVSQAFLLDALAHLPASVTAVADGNQAIAQLLARHFDAVLLDRGLPGPDAIAIRQAATVAGSTNAATPMLALSADVDEVLRERFMALGFDDLLAKPITAVALRTAVRRMLPAAAILWDDAQALRAANGSADIVIRLRQLMAVDLPRQRDEIAAAVASGNRNQAHDVLHRLKAACAFCGAVRLARACSNLDDELRAGASPAQIDVCLEDFLSACQETADTEMDAGASLTSGEAS
ncbi:MAG: response regulator [Xanthomonadales bacterium]|nr:response regulator [Xanthomonadales bacterium]